MHIFLKKIEKPSTVTDMTPKSSLFLFIVIFNGLCLLAQHKEPKHAAAMQLVKALGIISCLMVLCVKKHADSKTDS